MSITGSDIFYKAGTTKKYDIPIVHLDYEYIRECKDVKELEKILKVLRSGDEGYYPDMERECEERIKTINPESRTLRKDKPLTTIGQLDTDERQALENDMKSWTNDMKFMEHDLQRKPGEFDDDSLPPIRSGTILLNGDQPQSESNAKAKKNKSVKPRSYAEWDKFDLDKELEKTEEDTKAPKSKTTSSGSRPLIEEVVDTSAMSESERERKANMEKEKGNEEFRSGDYNEAIAYYTRSISLQPTAASFNNRALCYLKITEWMKAETDCDKVLNLEPNNIKALLRRGSAYKGKKEFNKALSDFEKVLELEPANKRAEDLIKELKKEETKYEEEKKQRKEKGRRMVIEEVDEEESADEEIIVEEREAKQPPQKQSVKEEKSKQTAKNKKAEKQMVNGFHNVTKSKDDPKDIWESEEVSEVLGQRSEEVKPAKTVTNSQPPVKEVSAETSKKNDDERQTETSENREVEKSSVSKSDIRESGEKNEDEMAETENKDLDQKQEISENEINEAKEAESVEPQRPVLIRHELPADIAQMRESGNNLFKTGQYGEAMKKYTQVIEKLEKVKSQDHLFNLSLIYSNRAACHLKTGDCPQAIRDCDMSLDLVPHSIKPLLRRGQAYEVLERYPFAYRDYKHVLKIDSMVDMALQGSTRCQSHLQDIHGARWREKLPPIPSVSILEIPEILDNTGKPLTTAIPSNQSIPPSQATSIASNQSAQSQVPASETKQSEVKKPEKDKTEPKLTKEQKFDLKKEEGNQFVKKMEFRPAIKCYTECIELLPDRTVSFTNRALCYLRVNEPADAESDCNKALSMEPENLKAMFRRAQAKKMLKKYKESLEDLTNLLKLDPRNSAAVRERDLVKNYWREELNALKTKMPDTNTSDKTKQSETKKTPASKPRKRMVIQEVDSEEEEEEVKISTSKPKQKSTQSEQASKKSERTRAEELHKQSSKQQNAKATQKASAEDKSKKSSKPNPQDVTESRQETTGKKAEAKSSPTKKKTTKSTKPTSMGLPTAAPSTPKLEKANPYEFIQAWNSIKSAKDIDPYADLIRQIPPSDIPKVISNKLDGQMLNTITKCVADRFIPQGEMELSYNILANLCRVPRFGTIAMFLSAAEIKEIKSVFTKLQESSSSAYSSEDLTRLRKEYNVK